MADDELDQLVRAIFASARYRDVAEEVIRNIGTRELARRRNLKEAIKATKSKLHQVGGAYLDAGMPYARWTADLARAFDSGVSAEIRRTCAGIMSRHASTRERLPILDQFYPAILSRVGPVHTIVDLACGLNPLAIPWMALPEQATYYAYDIYQDMIDFLIESMARLPIQGHAEARDVTALSSMPMADLALILKALPCLEQIDKNAGLRLLEAVRARHLVVSFPIHSLGGRTKGMAANYEAGFRALVEGRAWSIEKLAFATELVFIVTK